MIYFDNAATTYPKPEIVYERMDKFYRNFGVNAGRGSYNAANKASKLVEDTRKKVGSLIGINKKDKVAFTESATIALNLILKGLEWKEGDVIYYSPFEHNSVLRTLNYLQNKYSIKLKQMPVKRNGLEFDLDRLKQMFSKNSPKLVAVSHVSNVCGVIAPIDAIAKLAKKYNSQVLVDGAQGAGLIDVDLDDIDYYVWAGHKTLYGPYGIAGVIINEDMEEISPLIHGGTGKASEKEDMPEEIPIRYEAGSSNIQAITGLNASLKWMNNIGRENIYNHEKELTLNLIEVLNDYIDVNLFTPEDLSNHFNVVSINVSGYSPHDFGKILDEKFDIAVRTGLHCAPQAHEFFDTMPNGLVRFSLGYFNTEKDIEELKKFLSGFLI